MARKNRIITDTERSDEAANFIKAQLGLPVEEQEETINSKGQSHRNINERQMSDSRKEKSYSEIIKRLPEINLPQDAKMLFESRDLKCSDIENLYLLHHRFSRWERMGKWKKKLVSFLKSMENQKSPFKLDERAKKLSSQYADQVKICYEPLDKMMIGIGGESPYSSLSLIALHPLYGLPYLPASAIKGMFRSYYEQEKTNENEVIDLLFGDKEDKADKSRGELIFFDIFPQLYDLDFEVITPHYQNGKNPTDDQNPIPLKFPCVKNAEFHVYVACQDKELLKDHKVKENLKEAFKFNGIGAKTALGYGLGK